MDSRTVMIVIVTAFATAFLMVLFFISYQDERDEQNRPNWEREINVEVDGTNIPVIRDQDGWHLDDSLRWDGD